MAAAKQLNVSVPSVKPLLMAKAKENLSTSTGGKNPRPLSNLTKAGYSGEANRKIGNAVKDANTRKQIAIAAGVSEGTVHKVEKVLASGNESAKADMLSGKTKIDAAFKAVTQPTSVAVPKSERLIQNTERYPKIKDLLVRHRPVRKNGRPKKEEAAETVDNVNGFRERPNGNSRAYLESKLQRDFPARSPILGRQQRKRRTRIIQDRRGAHWLTQASSGESARQRGSGGV